MPYREISPDRMTLGGHKFALSSTMTGSRLNVGHAERGISAARKLGWKTVDNAPLYRSAKNIGAAMDQLEIPVDERRVYTKVLRSMALTLPDSKEHQPEAMLASTPFPFDQMTDVWDTGENAIKAQLTNEAALFGIDRFEGVALHDPPDKRVQAGLDWEADIAPAVKVLSEYKKAGRVKRIGLGVKDPRFVEEFVAKEPGVLDYAMVTFCPIVVGDFLRLIRLAETEKYELVAGGIYWGGAFVVSGDPRRHKGAPMKDRPIFNYEPATDADLDLLGKYYDVCSRSDVSLPQLSAWCIGQLAVTYPNVVTRIVTSALDPEKLARTMDQVCNVRVSAQLVRDLKSQDLLPDDFPA